MWKPHTDVHPRSPHDPRPSLSLHPTSPPSEAGVEVSGQVRGAWGGGDSRGQLQGGCVLEAGAGPPASLGLGKDSAGRKRLEASQTPIHGGDSAMTGPWAVRCRGAGKDGLPVTWNSWSALHGPSRGPHGPTFPGALGGHRPLSPVSCLLLFTQGIECINPEKAHQMPEPGGGWSSPLRPGLCWGMGSERTRAGGQGCDPSQRGLRRHSQARPWAQVEDRQPEP